MSESEIQALHAYHDGELRGLARWRLERRLRREPRLRRQLAALEGIGELVREREAEAGAPDLWDAIALRLPAVDARREQPVEERRGGLPAWLRPAGALAVAAALLLAVYVGWFESAPAAGGVVRWIDSGGRPVLVLEEGGESDVTIIWMLDDAVDGAARGGRGEVA